MTSPKIIQLGSWPQPTSYAGTTFVYGDESSLLLRYATQEDSDAIIKFPLVRSFKFGAPNDEALGGHPLAKYGLGFYGVYKVEASSWIQELEQCNSVHPSHDRSRFIDSSVHYIFTFKDVTLECVAVEGKFWTPEIEVFSSTDSQRIWLERVSA